MKRHPDRTDAIHDGVAGEFLEVAEKVTPAVDDLLLIEDSAADGAKRHLKISNLPAGGGGGGSVSYFPIWAEENAGLGASNTYEWAFGNGSNTAANEGVVMYVPSGFECHCVAMGAQVDGATPSATIELVLNGTPQGESCQVVLTSANTGVDELQTPLAISSGDLVNFRTASSSGTTTSCRVVAWFRMQPA